MDKIQEGDQIMYEFIDVNEMPASSLPAEALQINGIYIENEIEGYRTLTVAGRELIGASIEDYTVGNNIGTYYRRQKLPARTITVTYQLISSNPEDYRKKFNKLNGIIRQEQAKLIFNDELDKYFIGTAADIDAPDPGSDCVVGSINFYCADPRKYSVHSKSFAAHTNDNGILTTHVVNEGTVEVPIDYEIKMNSDNGYIGIISKYGSMQYGLDDQADTELRQRSDTLISSMNGSDFFNDKQIINDNVDGFSAYTYPVIMNGTISHKIYTHPSTKKSFDVLYLSNQGSGTHWHGASKTIMCNETAKNFTFTCRAWCDSTTLNQTGMIGVRMLTGDNRIVCDLHIVKPSKGNNDATVYFRGGNGNSITDNGNLDGFRDYKSFTFQNSQELYGKYGKPNGGNIGISKSAGQITFDWCGLRYSTYIPAVSELETKKVMIFIAQAGSNTELLSGLKMWDVTFIKDNVDYYYDLPNRYTVGDVITIDGGKTTVYKNGSSCMHDEILGSSYFMAYPGDTEIQFTGSSWAVPYTAQATIREAWL